MTRFSLPTIRRHLRRHHPGCPDFAIDYFANEVANRDWGRASLGQAVGITLQNFLRHEMTEYDTLLLHGMDRAEARRRVQPRIDAMLRCWKSRTSPEQQKHVEDTDDVQS
jgi:hypothetical protein